MYLESSQHTTPLEVLLPHYPEIAELAKSFSVREAAYAATSIGVEIASGCHDEFFNLTIAEVVDVLLSETGWLHPYKPQLTKLCSRIVSQLYSPTSKGIDSGSLHALGEFCGYRDGVFIKSRHSHFNPLCDPGQELRIVDLYSGPLFARFIPTLSQKWKVSCVDSNPFVAGLLTAYANRYDRSDHVNARMQSVETVDFRSQSVDVLRIKNGSAYDMRANSHVSRLSECVKFGGRILIEEHMGSEGKISLLQDFDNVAIPLLERGWKVGVLPGGNFLQGWTLVEDYTLMSLHLVRAENSNLSFELDQLSRAESELHRGSIATLVQPGSFIVTPEMDAESPNGHFEPG